MLTELYKAFNNVRNFVLFVHSLTQGFPTANIYANILQDVGSFPGGVCRIFAAQSITFTLSEGK